MRLRFLSFIALGVTGAFLVAISAALSLSVIQSIALGVSIGVLVVFAAVATRFREHLVTVGLSGAAAVISALMVIATQVYRLDTVKNLTFVEGIALGAIALIGLLAHELTTERVVHSLEVGARERRPQSPMAA